MDKINVSYYLPESLVFKLDERSRMSGNRSRQMAEDLSQFYDILDYGVRSALRVFSEDELKIIIQSTSPRMHLSMPSWTASKAALLDAIARYDVEASALITKIQLLDNLTCYALFDWARSNL